MANNDVWLGTGMAEKTKETVRSRPSKIDSYINEAEGKKPVKKTSAPKKQQPAKKKPVRR